MSAIATPHNEPSPAQGVAPDTPAEPDTDARLAYPTPLDGRWLVTAVPFVFWAGATGVIEALSFVPSLAPADPWWWRIGLGVPAVMVLVWLGWLGRERRRVSERTLQRSMLVVWMLSALVNLVVLLITPATFAVLVDLVQTAIAAGLYFRPRVVLAQMAVLAAITTTPLYLDLPGQQHHAAAAWLIIYLPVVWFSVAVVAVNRSLIQRALDETRTAAHTDPLTGLANRRELQRLVDAYPAALPAAGGILLIDLDNFKAANTLYGHPGGDHALRTVAAALGRAAPASHVVARIGGDEIAVYAPDDSAEQLAAYAPVYREAVRSANAELALPGVELDASVGVASRPLDGTTLAELLGAADRDMYAVKATRPRRGAPIAPERAAGSREVTGPPRLRLVEPPRVALADASPAVYRPLQRQASLMAGILAAACVLTLVGQTLPGADTSHPLGVTALCGTGLAVALVIAVLRPSARVLEHPSVDVAVAVAIAALLRLSGGFTSPALPFIFLLALLQSMGATRLPLRIVLPGLVLLSPLAYALPLPSDSTLTTIALVCAVVPVSASLTFALFGIHYVLTELERRSRDEATHDPLTGLPNRRAFIDELGRHLGAAPAAGATRDVAVVVIDLDNFADVNNLRGHDAGDALLRNIAGALRQVTRKEDCLARIGGDEFAAILHGVDGAAARALTQRFVNAVGACCARDRDPVVTAVTASAGFALHPEHGDTADELIARADEALMEVKDGEKGRVQAFLGVCSA